MKSVQFIILFLLIGLSFGCQQKECAKYKVGKFMIKGDEVYPVSYSIRTDSTEIIYNDSIGYKDEFKINWVTDCEYYMVFKTTNNPKMMNLSSSDTIFIQIVETTSNRYKYRGKVHNREYLAEAIVM